MRVLIGLLVLCCSWSARADGVFDHPATPAQLLQLLGEPARKLAAEPALSGTFAQRKFLRELPAPLKSDGDFVFSKELGIAWHTAHPFDSEFILTRDGMTQRAEGTQTMHLSADQQPAVRVAARLFFALFALDVEALGAEFDLFGVQGAEGWQMGLRPKGGAMATVFAQAVIRGDAQIGRIELQEANGDRSEIDLVKLERLAGLTDEQRKRFPAGP